MISAITNKNYQPNFRANPNLSKLKFAQKDFFIKIPGYGRDANWAKEIVKTAEEASDYIKHGWSFENVLKIITLGVIKANRYPLDIDKRTHTGILRIAREGWRHGSDWDGSCLVTNYDKKNGNKRYSSYESRLDEVAQKPLKKVYQNVSMTQPLIIKIDNQPTEKQLFHGAPDNINETFKLLNKMYKFLTNKYLNKNLYEKDLNIINNIISQMRWILAHTTPWERGSDAISNVFMKSLYKALNIKTFAPAKGISFDLEAYCTNLVDYRKNFSGYFEKPPEIVHQKVIQK